MIIFDNSPSSPTTTNKPYRKVTLALICLVPFAYSEFALTATSGISQQLPTNRKYIYTNVASIENRGNWTNMMAPEGIDPSQVIKAFNLSDTMRPLGEAGESIRIDFALKPLEWAGVAVASCPNCWGKPPCPQSEVYTDLKGATSLVFHARGDRGGEIIEVKVAITGRERCGDSAELPRTTLITLTPDWRRYEIDLEGLDLTEVITPFAVFVSRANNDQSTIIHLDEIYFDFPL